MKPKNMHIYSLDREYLATLREEYIMLGFDTKLEKGHLTVLTLPRKRKGKKKHEKHERDKRREKFERRDQ